jgi:hypothetical protein
MVDIIILKILLILVVAPLQIFIIHMAASRCLRQIPPQLMVVGCALIGQIPIGLILWFFVFLRYPMSLIEVVITSFYAFIVYNALAYTYFHLFNMSETARRIKILYEINRAGSLSKEAIPRNYGISEMLSVRLKRLIAMKQLRCKGNRYVLAGRILYFAAWIVLFWSRLLGFRDAHLTIKNE